MGAPRAKWGPFLEVMIFWNFRRENTFFWVTTSYLGDFNKTLITFDLGLLVPNVVHFWSFWVFEVIGAKIIFFSFDTMLGRFQENADNFWLRVPRAKWSPFLEFIIFWNFRGENHFFWKSEMFPLFQLFLKFSLNLLEKVEIFPVKSPSKTSILQSPKINQITTTTDLKKSKKSLKKKLCEIFYIK